MKKIKLIICSLLAIFLMMMLPSASAVEANAAEEIEITNSQYLFEIPDIDLKELKEKYEDDNVEPTFIILYTFLLWFLKVLRMIDVGIILAILALIISRIIGNNTTGLSIKNT